MRSSWASSTRDRARHHVTLPHITYTHGHCTYLYADGERCVWNGRLLDGMCAEHRAEVLQRERLARQAAKLAGQRRA